MNKDSLALEKLQKYLIGVVKYMDNRRISIYLRNSNITPSSYYRINQYAKEFYKPVKIRDIAPESLYKIYLKSNKKNKFFFLVWSGITYLSMFIRVSFYTIVDIFTPPEYVLVSKTFCPRYSPKVLNFLISILANKSNLIWDFDDLIFESGEISIAQASILEEKSKYIVVTNDFLKGTIKPKYQHKVKVLPTTDGDFKDIDFKGIKANRLETYSEEVKLVWVATAGNLRHLNKVINALDSAAITLKKHHNKRLILTVVCNRPLEVDVNNLTIRNILWTREIAKFEILSAHIGIMPLIEEKYSLGKGGFKLIQYISTGLPVIGSNVGYNSEIINDDCGILVDDSEKTDRWINAIVSIGSSLRKWEDMSEFAYMRWNEKFSFEKNLDVWRELINDN